MQKTFAVYFFRKLIILTKNNLNKDLKQGELIKYRDLVLATLDYYLDNGIMKMKTSDFDSKDYFNSLKAQTIEHYQRGRLTRLKQSFRDMTEMQVHSGDLKFNRYIQDKTGYDIDIFKTFFNRINKIIRKGRITTDNQFYDIKSMMDELPLSESLDKEKLELLDRLLTDYNPRKTRKQ